MDSSRTLLITLMVLLGTTMAFVAVRQTTRRYGRGALRMMKDLPSNVVQYSQVPAKGKPPFTAAKIPRGLLKEHTTKAGTWGVIRVSQGQLRYQINEPTPHQYTVDADTVGIIEPQVKHEVAPLTDDVQFVVEFYRVPGTGPVDEKREGL